MSENWKLLVVDDDPDVVELLHGIFSKQYQVHRAHSGEKALEILNEIPVDLLVTDQRMPGMSGIELIERARMLRPGLLSVILTAFTDPPEIIDAINRGQVFRFVTKPWNRTDLRVTVENALQHVALRYKNQHLIQETNRRLAALEVFARLSREAATIEHHADLIDQLTSSLERVLPIDASAVLLLGPPQQSLTVRLSRGMSAEALEHLKYRVLEQHELLGQKPIEEHGVVVRFTGASVEATDERPRFESFLPVPLRFGGTPIGILAVATIRPDVFSEGDARILDILANQSADLLEAFREKRLAESRRVQQILQALPMGAVLCRPNGEVAFANHHAENVLGSGAVDGTAMREHLSVDPVDLSGQWISQGHPLGTRPFRWHEHHSVGAYPLEDRGGALNGSLFLFRERSFRASLVPSDSGDTPGFDRLLFVHSGGAEHDTSTAATLRDAGFTVQEVAEVDEAAQAIRQVVPLAVLVSLRDGTDANQQLLVQLKQDPETIKLPVAVLGDAHTLEGIHGAACIEFPIADSELIQAVDRMLSPEDANARVLLLHDDAEQSGAICDALSALDATVVTRGHDSELPRAMDEIRPDVVLFSTTIGEDAVLEGMHHCSRSPRLSHARVIVLAKPEESMFKIEALTRGADDFMIEPVDSAELCARVRALLVRLEHDLSASPTTRLPGGAAIEREVTRRLRKGAPFAFCYLDLDNLKAFNDHYGFAKADGVIRQTGELLRQVVHELSPEDHFLGHIAGDDFVFVSSPEDAPRLCREIVRAFDAMIPLYYTREDRKRGFIAAEDRFGARREFPLMSVSVVAIHHDNATPFVSHFEMSRAAAKLKKEAKTVRGSVFLSDRRE